jgi:hypothetical protein
MAQRELLPIDLVEDAEKINPATLIRYAVFTEDEGTADQQRRNVRHFVAHNT